MAEQDAARADAEALEWLLALHEDPEDAALVARFEAWRAGEPGRASAWAETARVYGAIGDTPPVHAGRWARLSEAPSGAAPRRARAAPRQARALPRRRLVAVLAASAAAVAVAVLAPGAMLALRADYVTGVGEVRNVRLADGSRVSLAPGSAIDVAYTGDRRDVRLIKGAAWFDVRHDPSRPFHVVAPMLEARVLGTAFEVAGGDRGGVAVQRGLVGVTATGRDREMQRVAAGRAVSLGADGRLAATAVAPVAVAAWRDGQLVVEDGAVGDVVAALRPWTRELVLVRGEGVARRRVTGVYNLRDPDGVVAALAKAYDLKVTRLTPWIQVISER